MISKRSKLVKLGIICGLLGLAIGVIFSVQRNSSSITVIHRGVRDTPQGPTHQFEISNSSPYRINWLELEPEYKLETGWTTAKLPQLPNGARPSPGNPEPLEPGATYFISGVPVTNVAHRVSVMWEIYPRDADLRPRWQKVADEWADRRGIRPPFLPHGIQRSPVIPPTSPDQIRVANSNWAQKADQQRIDLGAAKATSNGVSSTRIVFEGPNGLEGWTQGKMQNSKRSETWHYEDGALVTTTFGSIARDVYLPTMASVEFDLTWSNSLQLSVALYTDSLQPLNLASEESPQGGGFYSLQFNRDTVELFAVSPGVSVKSLGMANVAGLRDMTSVRVAVRIDKPDRSLWLYLNDTLIKQWEDDKDTLAKGTFLRFVNSGATRLEISKLVVSEWDIESNPHLKDKH